MTYTDNKPEEQGSEAQDFLYRTKLEQEKLMARTDLIDQGICPFCNGVLETRVENMGDQDCSKNVVRVFCQDCDEEILEDR